MILSKKNLILFGLLKITDLSANFTLNNFMKNLKWKNKEEIKSSYKIIGKSMSIFFTLFIFSGFLSLYFIYLKNEILSYIFLIPVFIIYLSSLFLQIRTYLKLK